MLGPVRVNLLNRKVFPLRKSSKQYTACLATKLAATLPALGSTAEEAEQQRRQFGIRLPKTPESTKRDCRTWALRILGQRPAYLRSSHWEVEEKCGLTVPGAPLKYSVSEAEVPFTN
jgi:hypothetical protein